MSKGEKCLAVIRIRGVSDIFREVDATMRMLHLTRNCHATLIDDRPSHLGMLQKTQNYVTWGEVSKDGVALLLKERGRLVGGERMTDKYAQEIGYKSLDDLAEALYQLKVEYRRLPRVKPLFRLHPPRKGFRGNVKKSYATGGATGYRGESIDDLVRSMV